MPKLSKDKSGYFKISVSPEIVRLFNLDPSKTYDWENIGGFPALKERKE
ncbi:MAG: hypothetical protein K8S00_04290 [Bacteroidales bacterium]|nr:hypothetical protein [Bacteroidales bacterium]